LGHNVFSMCDSVGIGELGANELREFKISSPWLLKCN